MTTPEAAGGVTGTITGTGWVATGDEGAGVVTGVATGTAAGVAVGAATGVLTGAATGADGTTAPAVALGAATAALVPMGGATGALLDADAEADAEVDAAVVLLASSLPPPPHAANRAAAAALEKMIRFMNGGTRLTRPFAESDSGRDCTMKRALHGSISALHDDFSAQGVSSGFCHQYVDKLPNQAGLALEVDGAVAFGAARQFGAIPL